MFDISKAQAHARDALKNAAIYGALANASKDADNVRDFRRLHELEISIANRWLSTIADEIERPRNVRFSISLTLLRISSKFLSVRHMARLLRNRLRRRLSMHVDDFIDADAKNEVGESMVLLNRVSRDSDADQQHVEHDSLATRSGALRAAVLGINDGLVSNTALVLGVAAGTADTNVILLAGAAGLLGGALSMAAGEYVSVVSQREFNENLVRWERAELLLWHDEEESELVEILRAKGLTEPEAQSAASRIMSDIEVALDVHVREELGIDPEDLGGSPTVAAVSSFAAFAGGALIPLLPFVWGNSESASVATSAIAAGTALFLVGGGLGWISGNNPIYGGLRMLLVGGVSGAITYGFGYLLGLQLA